MRSILFFPKTEEKFEVCCLVETQAAQILIPMFARTAIAQLSKARFAARVSEADVQMVSGEPSSLHRRRNEHKRRRRYRSFLLAASSYAILVTSIHAELIGVRLLIISSRKNGDPHEKSARRLRNCLLRAHLTFVGLFETSKLLFQQYRAGTPFIFPQYPSKSRHHVFDILIMKHLRKCL